MAECQLTVAEKLPVFGVGVNPTDYAAATLAIVEAARDHQPLSITALATHGLMTAVREPEFRQLVDDIDIVVPDGQPVRWALNHFHRAGLPDRVYGPKLALALCAEAERQGLSVFLFGSTEKTVRLLERELRRRYPALVLAGVQPDRFREATPEEDESDVSRINSSGAHIVLVGRGCPRQERWVSSHRGRIRAALVAVGAAFDYIGGTLPLPPPWMQAAGLEWLYRLWRDPRRLWRRYLRYNALFLVYSVRELARPRRPVRRAGSRR